METILGSYSVGTASMPLFPRPYCVLVRSRLLYTSAKTIKIASRPYRFLLRSFYVVQVRATSDRFYIDVMGTWSSVVIGVLVDPNHFSKPLYVNCLKANIPRHL